MTYPESKLLRHVGAAIAATALGLAATCSMARAQAALITQCVETRAAISCLTGPAIILNPDARVIHLDDSVDYSGRSETLAAYTTRCRPTLARGARSWEPDRWTYAAPGCENGPR